MGTGTAEMEQQEAVADEQAADTEDEQADGLTTPDATPDTAEAADADSEDVTDEDADPEPTPLDFDALLSDSDTLAKLLEHPEVAKVRNQSVADATNKVKQQTEARLKREAGSLENVATVVTEIFSAAGVDVASLEPKQVQRLQQVIGLNRAYEAANLAKEFPEKLLGNYDLPAEALTEALLLRDSNDVDGYLRTIVDSVVKTQTTKAWGDHGLDDVPAGSKLANEIAAAKKTWQVNEKKAVDMTTKATKNGKVENPPKTPKGGSATKSKLTFVKLQKMTQAEIVAHDQEEVFAVVAAGPPG